LLSMRTNNSVGIDAGSYPLGDLNDMVVSSLMSREALVAQFNIATTAAAGVFVGDIPVNPHFNRATDDPVLANAYELTPLSFCAYPYVQWRGEMSFKIEWVCSVFHRATIMVLYNPRSTTLTPPYIEYAPVLQHWTIALNGHGETTIDIPWKMQEHFRDVGQPSANPAIGFRNGTLTIFLLNPVTTNGGTSPIHLNIYAKSNDMALALPKASVTAVPVLTSMAKTSDKNFFTKFFGEEHAHTVKELASRFTSMGKVSEDVVLLGPNAMTYYIPVGPALKENDPFGVRTPLLSLVDFLSAAYVGVRGSYNLSMWPNEVGFPQKATGSIMYTSDYNAIGAPVEPLQNLDGWSAFTNHNMDINPSLEVTIPFYQKGMFYSTYEEWRQVGNTALKYTVFVNSVAAGERPGVRILKAAGDDFTFIGFRGLPTFIF